MLTLLIGVGAPSIFDMDNDGFERSLFISNGIYRDLTNQDYLQYISNEEVLKAITANNEVDYAKLIEIIPSNKLKNHAYKNLGQLEFETYENSGLQIESFSNGAAYGDLDNDGDLDLVVNNLNMESFVYRNTTMDTKPVGYLKFILKGEGKNKQAIGSKIEITSNSYSIENQPTRGFQSSVDPRPNFGLKTTDPVDVTITWPSGKVTKLTKVIVNQTLTLDESAAKEPVIEAPILEESLFKKASSISNYRHQENNFVDFNRDRLLHHMCSTEGPKMAMADINNDGKDDVFIGGSKGNLPVLLLGNHDNFTISNTNSFDKNQNSEDGASLFFDADSDGDLDLYVCSGGVEFSQYATEFIDRLYFNDGSGNFTLSDQKLPNKASLNSTSTVVGSDIDNDGDIDLFVGERAIPLKYGMPGSGFLLRNDGLGNFEDVTQSVAKDLKEIGMVTDAIFVDLDNDGDEDLMVVGEFMGVELFLNEAGSFSKISNNITGLKGWWNVIHKTDLDNDGDYDFILGNHGLNSRFKASVERPITLYSKDFDGNGFVDPILAFRAKDGKDYPYALRHNLIDQIKSLKKKFPNYDSFKNASIDVIFSPEELKDATKLEVTNLSSVIILNKGNFDFEVKKLPIEAQFSTIYAIASKDFDADGDTDIILGGNLYNVKPEIGRYDASNGVYLENMGKLKFKHRKDGAGYVVKGEVRDLLIHQKKVLVARNSDSLAVFKYE